MTFEYGSKLEPELQKFTTEVDSRYYATTYLKIKYIGMKIYRRNALDSFTLDDSDHGQLDTFGLDWVGEDWQLVYKEGDV